MAGGRRTGGGHGAGDETNEASLCVCLSVSVRAAVPACLKLCSMDGGDLEEQQTAPPLLCPPPLQLSSLVLDGAKRK